MSNQRNQVDKIMYDAEKCRKDYSYFVHYFWHTINFEHLRWNDDLDGVCIMLEQAGKRSGEGNGDFALDFHRPAGATNSSLFSIFYIPWLWLTYPNLNVITITESHDLSAEFARRSADIIYSKEYGSLYSNYNIRRDSLNKRYHRFCYVDRNGEYYPLGSRLSTSPLAPLTGYHFDLIITDNLDLTLGATREWFVNISHRFTNKKNKAIISVFSEDK